LVIEISRPRQPLPELRSGIIAMEFKSLIEAASTAGSIAGYVVTGRSVD